MAIVKEIATEKNEKGLFLPRMWQDDMPRLLDELNKDAWKWFTAHNRRNDLGPPKRPYKEGDDGSIYDSRTFSGGETRWLPYSWVEAFVRDSLEGMRCDRKDEDKFVINVHVNWHHTKLQWAVTVMRVLKEKYETPMNKALP